MQFRSGNCILVSVACKVACAEQVRPGNAYAMKLDQIASQDLQPLEFQPRSQSLEMTLHETARKIPGLFAFLVESGIMFYELP